MNPRLIESPFMRTLAQREAEARRVARLEWWVTFLAVTTVLGWFCAGLLVVTGF